MFYPFCQRGRVFSICKGPRRGSVLWPFPDWCSWFLEGVGLDVRKKNPVLGFCCLPRKHIRTCLTSVASDPLFSAKARRRARRTPFSLAIANCQDELARCFKTNRVFADIARPENGTSAFPFSPPQWLGGHRLAFRSVRVWPFVFGAGFLEEQQAAGIPRRGAKMGGMGPSGVRSLGGREPSESFFMFQPTGAVPGQRAAQ